MPPTTPVRGPRDHRVSKRPVDDHVLTMDPFATEPQPLGDGAAPRVVGIRAEPHPMHREVTERELGDPASGPRHDAFALVSLVDPVADHRASVVAVRVQPDRTCESLRGPDAVRELPTTGRDIPWMNARVSSTWFDSSTQGSQRRSRTRSRSTTAKTVSASSGTSSRRVTPGSSSIHGGPLSWAGWCTRPDPVASADRLVSQAGAWRRRIVITMSQMRSAITVSGTR